jgi:hypothetical protein
VRTISATPSPFVKRILPFVILVGVCGSAYWRDVNRGISDPVVWLLVAVTMVVIMVTVLLRGPWSLADKVEDCGDRLIVTRWRTSVTIPLSAVTDLQRTPLAVGSTVTLKLAHPCALGSDIRFLAPDKRKVPDIDQALDSLALRLAAQDSGHAA